MRDPFEEIAGAKKALREGLALLDRAAEEDPGAAEAAWGEVLRGIVSAPSPEVLRIRVPEESLEAFDDELEEILRLNAVLVAAVEQQKNDLLERLKLVRETRRSIAYYAESSVDGERCDISG